MKAIVIRGVIDFNMEKNLRFEENISPSGKTQIINVFSVHSDDFLGRIHWRSGWRCYVMSYQNDIDMSLSCSKELNEFMERLEENRRKK